MKTATIYYGNIAIEDRQITEAEVKQCEEMLGCSLLIDENLAHPDGVEPPTTWLAPGEMLVTFAKLIGEPLVEEESAIGLMVFVEELPWLQDNDD